uniref:HAD family hydrolase n=1 Tax=Syphacia muris TaxID=451379 RepID=A0A0N5AT59_9BILA
MAVVIPKLKSSGYLVGLLTNNVFLSKKKDESMVIKNAASRFDAVIESCREGVRKPNPKIYTAAASKLNVKPEECIYLDDFMENCKGADYDGTLSAICELEKLLQQKFL